MRTLTVHTSSNITWYDFVQDARDKEDYNESHIITAKRALKVQVIELLIHATLVTLIRYFVHKMNISTFSLHLTIY